VIEAAVDADDLDDAAALAARACALAPADERRLLLLASILRDAGRLPAAREALTGSLRLCAEFGAAPSVGHRALAASLGVPVEG
jgi:predicted TPR repeat methyltransferase